MSTDDKTVEAVTLVRNHMLDDQRHGITGLASHIRNLTAAIEAHEAAKGERQGPDTKGHEWKPIDAPGGGFATKCIHCGLWVGKFTGQTCPKTPDPSDSEREALNQVDEMAEVIRQVHQERTIAPLEIAQALSDAGYRRTPPASKVETVKCRTFSDDGLEVLCDKPARYIVWGHLYGKMEKGPKCFEHAPKPRLGYGNIETDYVATMPDAAIYEFPTSPPASSEGVTAEQVEIETGIREVVMFQAVCQCCGYACDDYGDYSAMAEPQQAIEDVTDGGGWQVVDGKYFCTECWEWPADDADSDDPVRAHAEHPKDSASIPLADDAEGEGGE